MILNYKLTFIYHIKRINHNDFLSKPFLFEIIHEYVNNELFAYLVGHRKSSLVVET